MRKMNKKKINNRKLARKAVVFFAITTLFFTVSVIAINVELRNDANQIVHLSDDFIIISPLAGEPLISNIDANPDPQTTGGYVNITCEVSDIDGIDEVYLNITDPNNNVQNFSITGNKTGNTYYCNRIYSPVGRYSYFIWANDTIGNSAQSTNRSFSIVNWMVTLIFNEAGNINDNAVFGEVDDAIDGKDKYDTPKPGAPPEPYVYAWFDAGLDPPYDRLWGDYRDYPDDSEVWNLTVEWMNQSSSGNTNVTISWDTDKVNDSEYDSVCLYNKDNGDIINMKTENTYLFNETLVLSYKHDFLIICDWVLSDDTTPSPTTGDPITFGVTLTNKKSVTNVKANYRWNHSGIWSDWTKDVSMTNGGNNNWATSGITAPTDAADVEYYFTINTDGNSIYIYNGSLALTDTESVAEGSPFNKTVTDNDPPTVTNVAVDTDPVYSGDLTQEVTVDFSESMDTLVDPAISFSDGTWTAGGGSWTDSDTYVETFTLTSSTEAVDVDVTVAGAQDVVGNVMSSHTEYDLFDIDNVAPTITNILATPSVTTIGGYVNITCSVSDINGIDTVNISITGPAGFIPINTTMNTGSYYYNNTYNIHGTYNYFIWANDTFGNSRTSTTKQFFIISPNVIPLHQNWNLISLPFNESINKIDIVVSYAGTNYSWNDAVSNNIVIGFIYGWNRISQTYGIFDTIEPGYGYWVWAYHNCELLVSSNISGDDNITTLKQKWNIMGIPYNTSLNKESLIIHYNGIDYTWQEAVDNTIILGFIYGWDRNTQTYMLSDEFDPGYGYWMYAYYDCTLKK